MSRDTRLSTVPIGSALKFLSPPPPSRRRAHPRLAQPSVLCFLTCVIIDTKSSYDHTYHDDGKNPSPGSHALRTRVDARRGEKCVLRLVVIQHSVFRSRRDEARMMTFPSQEEGKSKSSKRGLKGCTLRILAVDRER